MSNKPEVINRPVSVSMLTNSLFWAGLDIAFLLVVTTSIAGTLHWVSWDVFFHILVQIVLGLVIGGTAILFMVPRMQFVFGKTNLLTKCANIFLMLLGLALLSFLLTLPPTLWPTPEMKFFEKVFSNLGFVSGVVISLCTFHSRNSLH